MEFVEFLRYPVSFVIAIGVLVTVHEFGHFWVARQLGVKVLRFSVGFGKPLLSWRGRVDDTEFVLAAIPLGGYVKMLDESEGHVVESERGRAFNRQPLWVRYAVVAAGPAFNFVFAVVAFTVMFMVGTQGLRPLISGVAENSIAQRAGIQAQSEVIAVNDRVTPTWGRAIESLLGGSVKDQQIAVRVRQQDGREDTLTLDLEGLTLDDLAQGDVFEALGIQMFRPRIPARIGEISAGGAASQAGLSPGDLIVRVDGKAIDGWSHWRDEVRSRPGVTMQVDLERDGQALRLAVTPKKHQEGEREVGFIGASPVPAPELFSKYYVKDQLAPLAALSAGLTRTADATNLMVNVLWKMVRLEISFRNLSGPISIAEYAGLSTKAGFATFLSLLAMLSVSLGVLNLLPIPMLDGGHLLYYTIELIQGRPLSEAIQGAGVRLGIVFLVGLMSLAFYNDLTRVLG